MTRAAAYPPGVPCWVEALEPDPRAAVAYYGSVFGWTAAGPGPMPDGGAYYVAQLDGDDVAGIATLPPGGIASPAWTTYVGVDDLEAAVARVRDAGGAVVVPPLDALPAGRLAIVEAPAGGTIGLWKPADRSGVQRVNEAGTWTMSTLRTHDLGGAMAFYAELFDWRTEPYDAAGAPGVLFRLPGYVGGVPQQPVPRDVVAVAVEDRTIEHDHWSVDFRIADVRAAADRTAAAGGTVVVPPFDSGLFERAVLASPGSAIFTVSRLALERLARASTSTA